MSALAYHQDFYGWTQEQEKLLREHYLNELDLENLFPQRNMLIVLGKVTRDK